MFTRTDDPVADFHRYEAARERELKRLPRCCKCREHFQEDELFDSDGELICLDCMDAEK